MLKKFQIKNFKSIYDQEISLGAVNAFVGANGSGKSNILEALGVLSAAAAGRVDDEALQRRGVRPSIPRLYKSAFQESRESGFPHIFFEAQSEDASYSVSLDNTFTKPKPYWQYGTEKLVSKGETIVSRETRHKENAKGHGLGALKLVEMSEDSPAAVLMNALQNFAIYSPNTPMLRGVSPDPQTREPVGLSGGRLADALEALQHLAQEEENIEDALEDILSLTDCMESFETFMNFKSMISPSVARMQNEIIFTDKFMDRNHNDLSAYDASEGVLYVLFCAALALVPQRAQMFCH
jgi:energy-coupling factor transporter ATP-binding protein EcfA2